MDLKGFRKPAPSPTVPIQTPQCTSGAIREAVDRDRAEGGDIAGETPGRTVTYPFPVVVVCFNVW